MSTIVYNNKQVSHHYKLIWVMAYTRFDAMTSQADWESLQQCNKCQIQFPKRCVFSFTEF